MNSKRRCRTSEFFCGCASVLVIVKILTSSNVAGKQMLHLQMVGDALDCVEVLTKMRGETMNEMVVR